MSRFAETLAALMAVETVNQATLADRTAISQATISRLLQNEREPSAEQVGKLAAALSHERARRVELVLAYVRDVVVAAGLPAGLDERHVVISPASDETDNTIHVGGTLGAELQLIADECAGHEDIRAVIVDLATLIRRHRAELVDARAGLYPFPSDAHSLTAHVAEGLADAATAATVAEETARRRNAPNRDRNKA